jgi:hypothetical protein
MWQRGGCGSMQKLKCSPGVWERFARQANPILRTVLWDPKPRSENMFLKMLGFGATSWGTKVHTLGEPAGGWGNRPGVDRGTARPVYVDIPNRESKNPFRQAWLENYQLTVRNVGCHKASTMCTSHLPLAASQLLHSTVQPFRCAAPCRPSTRARWPTWNGSLSTWGASAYQLSCDKLRRQHSTF